VVTVYERLLTSWNRRDANAFAALFAADGSCIGFDGSQMDGAAAIASELGTIFAQHPTASYVAKVRAVRPFDAQVTLLRAVAGMVPPGGDALNPAVNAIQSLIVSRVSGEPRIVLFQNTPAAFHGRPELAAQLTMELTAVHRAGRIVEPG
jgi:uncharacterized protein (TIGR02246 family)